MDEDRQAAAQQPEASETQDAPAPHLPASFFSKLVHQPKCITEGVCNNCGRCEH